MIYKCRSCGRLRDSWRYLCPPCWRSLPLETRRRLNLKDSEAGVRLIELMRELGDGVPLGEIEVRP